MLPSKNIPCKGCKDRYPGCSDRCKKESFLNWKEEQRVIKEGKKQYFEQRRISYESKCRERCLKYSGRGSEFGFSYNRKKG